jgi:hypothetical protein
MATFTEIPELVKIMTHLFGERWGKRLGRAAVILIIAVLAGAAVTAVMAGVGRITSWVEGLSPHTSAILLTILGVIIMVVGMMGLALGLGTFFGVLLRVGLASPMRRNVDLTLEQTETILTRAKQSGIQGGDIEKLLSDLEVLKNKWKTSRITRMSNWLAGGKK